MVANYYEKAGGIQFRRTRIQEKWLLFPDIRKSKSSWHAKFAKILVLLSHYRLTIESRRPQN